MDRLLHRHTEVERQHGLTLNRGGPIIPPSHVSLSPERGWRK
jgi:hypothetical protein